MAETQEKQPRQLYMLFLTEMWERFSFYGMRSLLTLYMTLQLFKDLADPEAKSIAYGIYAAYGALVYATPYIGGLLADKLLGYQKSTLWGGVLMMIGHFVMAIETEFFLYLALAFLIAGNGFFKPNISSMVGGLYREGDPRRDGGFTIFYMGINLGAFAAPLICGYIGETYGWFYGFGLAGLGMLTGLLVFERGRGGLGEIGGVPNAEKLYRKLFLGLNYEHLIYIGSILGVALVSVLIRFYHTVEILIPFATGAGLLIVLIQSFRREKVEMQRIFVILILTIVNIFFWAFFEQAGSSLTLLTESNVNRKIFGAVLPASIFQSVNPAFILILGPMFASMWVTLGRKGKEPSTPLKFVFGMVLLGIGFLFLAFGVNFVSVIGGAALIPLIFLVISYMLQTCGELSLSPVGLSMITKLAPRDMTALLMGMWFLSTALSHTVAGQIATMTAGGQNPEVASLLKDKIKQSKIDKEKEISFSEAERKLLLDWKDEGFIDRLEEDIEARKLDQEQVSSFSSGNQYEARTVLEDSLKGGRLLKRELTLLGELGQEPLVEGTPTPELDERIASRLKSLTSSDIEEFPEKDEEELKKWAEDRISDEEERRNALDTLMGAVLEKKVSPEQVQVIATEHRERIENALDDSLKGGQLSRERVDELIAAAIEPGKVAVNNEVLTQEEIEKRDARTLSSFDQLSNYTSVYTVVGWVAVGTGVVLILFIPVLRKWMHGVH